ncbi:7433_t:CDS:1, partial [Dentiscutata erythropus]
MKLCYLLLLLFSVVTVFTNPSASERSHIWDTKEGKCVEVCGLPTDHPLSEYICFKRCMKLESVPESVHPDIWNTKEGKCVE